MPWRSSCNSEASLQSLDERSVRFEDVLGVERRGRDPLQALTVERPRDADEVRYQEAAQLDAAVRIIMAQREQMLGRAGLARQIDIELFGELAREGDEIGLTCCDLAPGELPTAGQVLAGWALGDEHRTGSINDRRGHNRHGRHSRHDRSRGVAYSSCP